MLLSTAEEGASVGVKNDVNNAVVVDIDDVDDVDDVVDIEEEEEEHDCLFRETADCRWESESDDDKDDEDGDDDDEDDFVIIADDITVTDTLHSTNTTRCHIHQQ